MNVISRAWSSVSLGIVGSKGRKWKDPTEIFMPSFALDEILADWRVATVVPLFRKDYKNKSGIYKPVSLTPSGGKGIGGNSDGQDPSAMSANMEGYWI